MNKTASMRLDSPAFRLDQEKQAALMAAQAVMNPHFFFNLLNVISEKALEGEGEAVAEICDNLSAMLRYSAAYPAAYVPLSEELAYTRAYFMLMKSRYEALFDFTIEADSALLGEIVPKLSIQPLCERVLDDALLCAEQPCHLRLCVAGDERGCRIQLFDGLQPLCHGEIRRPSA